ncbi:MAG: molybdopterin-dependent oxidoreductase [Acidimicrobiales bacterium]
MDNTEHEHTIAIERHRRGNRWMHWINFPLLTVMIWSGLRIYWADLRDPFVAGIGGWEVFTFFPDWVNGPLGLERRLARGMAFHFSFGWLFLINGIAFAVYLTRTKGWRNFVPSRSDLSNIPGVLRHEIGRGELPPQGKYNVVQQLTYAGVLGMGALAVLSGFSIYKPTQLAPLTSLLGGYESARTIHWLVTMGFLAFFVLHLVQVVRAGFANFFAMITGFERVTVAEATDEPERVPTLSTDEYVSRSRRSVLTGIGGIGAAAFGWRWVQTRPADANIPDVLRDVHQANESIWRGLFREGANAPTFDFEKSSMMRVNGRHGIREEIDLDAWELTVIGADGAVLGTHTLDDLRGLPQIEMIVEHKCIEGWSHVVAWGGTRFSDFVETFHPDQASRAFVGLATPDDEYRVGLEIDAMLHPQTMLALDLQRAPLTDEHGAPVRLATPLKYGIKQIKRIGTIQFSDVQPEGDYWASRGYDWYAAL